MFEIVPPQIDSYVEAHTSEPPEHLRRLAEDTHAELECPRMLTGAVEGRFLEMLVHASGARLVLELGTYSGYSALSMAQALPADGRIVSCEISEEHAAFARERIEAAGESGRIEVRVGPALETIASLGGPFDLVFIDADKESYAAYYEAVLPKLADRGLIAVDNVLWSGRVADPANDEQTTRILREFNDMVRADERVVSVMLTVRDGITLLRRA
ncbi:MAG TPA: class I SAM-dependent methyltransferase [Thermoleophilaceae bacterium]|nr:class I SAM-dependent methyltransferase [Thermoleophilaceae bacterium]